MISKSDLIVVLIFISLLFLSFKSSATHMLGADRTYACLNSNKFKLILRFYRDLEGLECHPSSKALQVGGNHELSNCSCSMESKTIKVIKKKCPVKRRGGLMFSQRNNPYCESLQIEI